jgi:hypothetical protein
MKMEFSLASTAQSDDPISLSCTWGMGFRALHEKNSDCLVDKHANPTSQVSRAMTSVLVPGRLSLCGSRAPCQSQPRAMRRVH